MSPSGGDRILWLVFAGSIAVLGALLFGLPRPLQIVLAATLLLTSWLAALRLRRTGQAWRVLSEQAQTLVEGSPELPIHQTGPGGITELSDALQALSAQLVTQRGRLSSQRDLLEAVLTGMEEAILVVRPGGRLLLANRAASKLLSIPEHADDQPLIDVVRSPAVVDAVQRALGGQAAPFELADFGPRQRALVGRAAPLPSGGTAAAVVVIRDVTEMRALEAMRRNFVASASHELRTPVAAIRGYAETLEAGALADDGTAKRFIAGLSRQAERLSDLIDDLLDLSRIESGSLQLEPQRISVRSAVARRGEVAGDRLREKGLRVEVIEPDGELFARADPTAIGMVVGNLLDNAIKYSPAQGKIEIESRLEGERLRLEVRDQGPGIDAQHHVRIFERFYRVDPGRAREVGGTGLGLAIVKHVIQQSGGDVGVRSFPGRGATFWVQLPAAPAPPAEEGAPSPEP